MAYHYKYARKFHDAVAALCKPGCYNLVLHKHLGDVFYAIGAKDEFEATYSAKLRFIIRPQHEFLMEMYGVKDYSVYDLDALVKKNRRFKDDYFRGEVPDMHRTDRLEREMFQAVFKCLPIKGEPFVCESAINDFFTYPRFWAYRWATNMGVEDDFRFAIPERRPVLSFAAKKAFAKIASLDKIVLIAPEAATATEFPIEFWNIIAETVHKKGYKILINGKKYKIKHGQSVDNLSLPDVVALGLRCAYVFSLRSGLCDVLIGAKERLYAFYPALLHREMHGLNKCFEPMPGVNEIAVWRWKIDKMVWENEDLTHILQRYINQLHCAYWYKKIKFVLAVFSRRRRNGHEFLYRILRDVAGKSKFFPENNIENWQHKCMPFRITLFGISIFSRKLKVQKRENFSVLYYVLGGIMRYKREYNRSWRLSVCGIQVYSHTCECNKLLGIVIHKYKFSEKWLARLQSQIDQKYDDIYLIRHNIGESYVELMHLSEYIKANKSKRPLVILWDRKYLGFYNMFIPKGVDVQYVKLEQSDIHKVFSGSNRQEKNIMLKHGKQRFFCSSADVAQNMKRLLKVRPDMNFYNYINECNGVKCGAKPILPKPSAKAVRRVEAKIKRLVLGKKFVILAPEATSSVRIRPKFWNALADNLKKKGYDIFANLWIEEENIKGAKSARMTIEELFVLSKKSSGVITLGSGLAVFLTAAGVKMDLIYTDFDSKSIAYNPALAIRIYSVLHLPGVSPKLVKEYDTDKLKEPELFKAILKRY